MFKGYVYAMEGLRSNIYSMKEFIVCTSILQTNLIFDN